MKRLGLRVGIQGQRLTAASITPYAKRTTGRRLQAERARYRSINPLCPECEAEGRIEVWTELDHVQALINGGSDQGPKQGLCHAHHVKKTKQDWRQYRQAQPLSEEIVNRRLPSDLPRSRIPLTIVCGPPASGKNTYIKEHAGPNDVVIDLDAIQQELSGTAGYQVDRTWLAPALIERNERLSHLATDHTHDRAWFIVGAPKPQERKHWASMLGGTVVLLDVPLEECIKRINEDPTRHGHEQRMIDAATAWWESNDRPVGG